MRLVLFTLTSPAPPKFPFSFSSHLVQSPQLLVSRPFSFLSLYIYFFYLVASFFLFSCWVLLHKVLLTGLGWLASKLSSVQPASETHNSACRAFRPPPCTNTAPSVLCIRRWRGWPVILSFILVSCEHAYACRHLRCDWSHELRCALLPPLLT